MNLTKRLLLHHHSTNKSMWHMPDHWAKNNLTKKKIGKNPELVAKLYFQSFVSHLFRHWCLFYFVITNRLVCYCYKQTVIINRLVLHLGRFTNAEITTKTWYFFQSGFGNHLKTEVNRDVKHEMNYSKLLSPQAVDAERVWETALCALCELVGWVVCRSWLGDLVRWLYLWF